MFKNTTFLGISLLVFLTSIVTLSYLYSQNTTNKNLQEKEGVLITEFDTVDESDLLSIDSQLTSLEEESLSEQEITGLLLMREEEKLAYDVYTTLYDFWGQSIFYNIAQSEQTHQATLDTLITKYHLTNPTEGKGAGVFRNIELQALYTSLVEQGKESLTEALTVGIAIEELDIRDLRNLSEEADNEDLLLAYANLEKGSRNHLRSFTHILQKNGGDYQAQYLTDEEVKAIINSAYERGLVD